MTEIDETARAEMIVIASKTFDFDITEWAKKGVTLTDEAKAKAEAAKASLKDAVTKLDLGASTFGVVAKLLAEVRATLPPDEQAKLNAKRPTSAPERKPGNR